MCFVQQCKQKISLALCMNLSVYSCLFVCYFFLAHPAFSSTSIGDSHTHQLAITLAKKVESLSIKIKNQPTPAIVAPEVVQRFARQSQQQQHHASMRKVLHILVKLNRLRNMLGLPPSAAPLYPTHEVTPEDIYWVLLRAIDEVDILLSQQSIRKHSRLTTDPTENSNAADTLIIVTEVSHQLDNILSESIITPTHVYQQAIHILDTVRFIRTAQRYSPLKESVSRPTGKHHNHSLQATYQLLEKISQAQKNLGIQEIWEPNTLPMRKIAPIDVLKGLQQVSDELEEIKYHLGLGRHISLTPLHAHKTANDVIQVLTQARLEFPTFSNTTSLKNFNYAPTSPSLNDIYAITDHMLEGLTTYHSLIGIQAPQPTNTFEARVPQLPEVLSQTASIFSEINWLYTQEDLPGISSPEYPSNTDSLQHLFTMMTRMDQELAIYYKQTNGKYTPWIHSQYRRTFQHKTLSDIQYNLVWIRLQLDSISGSKHTPVQLLTEQLQQLRSFLAVAIEKELLQGNSHMTHEALNTVERVREMFIASNDRFHISERLIIANLYGRLRASFPSLTHYSYYDLLGQSLSNTTPIQEFNAVLAQLKPLYPLLPPQTPTHEGKGVQ